MCGRLRVGKRNLHVAGLVGAAMCSACRCGSKAAFTLVLILIKCIATHVDFGLSRLSTPANLLVLLQRYIPT